MGMGLASVHPRLLFSTAQNRLRSGYSGAISPRFLTQQFVVRYTYGVRPVRQASFVPVLP